MLSEDIREIYAEAKGRGFDKTAIGQVVAYVRKLNKVGQEGINERTAIFDLYLDAYQSGAAVSASHTPARARTREIIEEFDAETGEILDRALLPEMSEIMDMDAPEEPKPVKAKTNAKRPSRNDKSYPEAGPQAEASHVGTDTGMLADREGRHEGEAVSADLPTNSPETATETMGGTGDDCSFGNSGVWPPQEGESSNLGNDSLNVVTAGETAPQFTPPSFLVKKSISDFRPHCQKPDACGASGLKHCYSCSKLIPAESEAA